MSVKPSGALHRRVWRPDLAYAVGLIATDGNLSSRGFHICLVSRDIDQLNTFRRILGIRNTIGSHRGGFARRPVFRVTLGDRLFHEWLTNIGVTPRKSHTIGALAIPDDYFRDFLRGHLDGDGCITAYVDRHNAKLRPNYVYQRLYVRFMSASRAHMEWLRDRITTLIAVDGYLIVDKRSGDRTALHRLHFAKKDAITLLRWIYYSPDVPCLRRKRIIAEPFLTGDIRDFRHPPGLKVRERRSSYVIVARA